MKKIIKRVDAFLILLAAVVYRSNDPLRTCLIGVSALFILGWIIDGISMYMAKRRMIRHMRWRAELEDSDRRFAHLLAVMEDFGR